jgi:hypothetical protein
MLHRFLSSADSERAFHTFRKLLQHDVSRWALAGSLALEIHCLLRGQPPPIRPLNDIDFVAAAFNCIPETLAKDFLFRHVHPLDPPGKTMLQLIDARTSMRIDLFRAYGAIMSRTVTVHLPSGPIQLISLEDVLARTARLLLDLDRGVPVPVKHAHDYLRLLELVRPSDVETAWRDHRKATHPSTFSETNALLQMLIPARRNLLIAPEYSKDTSAICPRCTPHSCFPLADANVVLSLLGYC